MGADPLAGLRDIHLPPDPSWWPPAPGWWVVAAAVLAAVVAAGWFARSRVRRGRPRRWALATLERIVTQPDPGLIAAGLSELMRRAAIHRYPGGEVAGLTGCRWLEFLDRTGFTDQFTEGPGQVLVAAPYSRDPELDPAALRALAERWLRRNL